MAQPPSRPSPVAFACGFARRNCPHEVMFQDAYQRTNRTRGTKILRCFPHCCPRHVDRSYCGSSVYLQVDLAGGDLGAIDDATLCVFAHFHPKAAPGLALGQRVARALFRENQQTDTNATGEWIGARLVASADRTTWMFEVNPSGRWYYQWESGATKAQRATEHVFEAYVLVVDAAFERCEVVAKAVSRDFKMISFRRAPSEPKPSTPEVSAAELGSPAAFGDRNDREIKSTADEEAPLAVSASSVSSRWMQRNSVDSLASSDAEMASRIQTLRDWDAESRTSSPIVDLSGMRLSQASLSSLPTPPSSVTASPQPHTARDAPWDELSPLSLLPPPQIVRISHQLGALVDFVLVLPCAALELVAPEIRHGVLGPFGFVGDSRTSGAALAGLMGLPNVTPGAQSAASPFPPAITGAVQRLVLWLLFDREFTHAQEAYLNRASAGLLDKVALYESYYAWLERLEHHIDMYLAAMHIDLTLDALANDARAWLLARGSSCVPTDAGASSGTCCRGLEAFVAQAREVFLAGDDLRPRRRRSAAHHHREDDTASPGHQAFALLSALWVVDIDSIRWRGVAAASDRGDSSGTRSSSAPSAFGIMWAWRQVLGLELQVDDDGTAAAPATLTVSSLWNPSRRPEASSGGGATAVRGSRLVLDGKPRWLRVYPSGESTSSVAIGSQRIGHYVASFRYETRELLVNLYSWPAAPTTTTTGDDAWCFCSRWCLRLESGESTLSVRVAVERGRIKRGVNAAALDEKPLTHKLQAVDGWTTTASLQYAYLRR